jgi:hypothetical protein
MKYREPEIKTCLYRLQHPPEAANPFALSRPLPSEEMFQRQSSFKGFGQLCSFIPVANPTTSIYNASAVKNSLARF